jgi:REP-associated tyrosine transposase
MARLARVIAVDMPHHVTQRGNARRLILDSDSDRLVYLELLRHYCGLYELSLLGYCPMSNHVHLIVIPKCAESLSSVLKHTHGRYATYWNASHTSSGHVWQGRYYSCPLDLPYLWAALRYTELNSVRASLATAPEAYVWSSAAAHCGKAPPEAALELQFWRKHWDETSWRGYLNDRQADANDEAIRKSTHTGRPLGSPEFIAALEESTHRSLAPQKGGRPPKPDIRKRQGVITFNV